MSEQSGPLLNTALQETYVCEELKGVREWDGGGRLFAVPQCALMFACPSPGLPGSDMEGLWLGIAIAEAAR